jgi:alpha-tubulin suppressor-like RCC1 family protein
MKKILFFCAAAALFTSCKKEAETTAAAPTTAPTTAPITARTTALTLLQVPTPVAGDIVEVWGGAAEFIALRSDGTVWDWGVNDGGKLGNGLSTPWSAIGTNPASDRHLPFQVLGPGGTGHLNSIVAIAGAERHNIALKNDGTVWAWGWNNFGMLGLGTTTDGMLPKGANDGIDFPSQIPNFNSVIAINARGYHTMAKKSDGTIWTWGLNTWGQLGDGTNSNRWSPTRVTSLVGHTIDYIAGGGDFCMALLSNHTVLSWGRNDFGEVGNGTFNTIGQFLPTPVVQTTGLTNIKAIAAGWSFAVALSADGTVWTWGLNNHGQLGDGTTTNRNRPVQVHGLSNVIQVSAGDNHIAVLKSDGTVWAWGWNATYGQIGDGTAIDRHTPVQVRGLSNIVQVRARDYQNLAVKADGTLWEWGGNAVGQAGNNTFGNVNRTPVQVSWH